MALDENHFLMAMTHLFQRVHLKCPYNWARTDLERSLNELVAEASSQLVRLHVPVYERRGLELQKDVVVTYGAKEDPLRFDPSWSIHWTPDGGGPYPDFDGALTLRAGEVSGTCVLELLGDYTPPLGIAGQAFDAVIGWRIASATARGLLRDIGTSMESRYQASTL